MAVHISLGEANAWLQGTKLTLSALEDATEGHASGNILGRLSQVFDTSTWVDTTNTPKLVRTIISMYYASYLYDRAYADDASDTSNYAFILRRNADNLVSGLLAGNIILPEDPEAADVLGQPSFFPNDTSSASEPTSDFPSNGPAAFTLGQVF